MKEEENERRNSFNQILLDTHSARALSLFPHTQTSFSHTVEVQNTKQKWTETQGFRSRGWLWLRALTAMTPATSLLLLAADR